MKRKLWAIVIVLLDFCSNCFCANSLLKTRGKICEGHLCTSLDCIDFEKLCDGIKDCRDGSDESTALCGNIHCPTDIFFRCSYGACIDLHKKCNGKKDCEDNSDEKNCIIVDDANSKCGIEEFECNNGQCIIVDGKCNGIVECVDGSDESESTCLNTFCPDIYFKCNYGACVDGSASCNGVKDCHDNSDENLVLCQLPTSAPKTEKLCRTPDNPDHGSWSYFAADIPYNPLTNVSINTAIQIICESGWLPAETDEGSTKKILVCTETGWTSRSNIECQKKCPDIYNTANMKVTCKKIGGEIISCTKATPGTTLALKCQHYYEPRSRSYERWCQANGEWNKELGNDECVPSCGEKKVTATKLIVNGSTVEKGHYPWTVALYQKLEDWKQVCGGSLISLTLVLTAAHCVADDDGNIIDASNFEIGAGKYFRPYKDQRDYDTAKYSKVKRILVHTEYQGIHQNYKADIAILLLKKKLHLSQEIQPVCLEKSNLELIHPNQTGVVTGWGYTESSGSQSDTLQELELPYKDESQCKSEIPFEWFLKFYKTGDKLCAGYYNRSTSVCQGDSGGGFVFKYSEVYDGHDTEKNSVRIKYHIIGIVSIGRQLKGQNRTFVCDIEKSALFTKVPKYLNWIKEQLSLYP